ncbi:arsenite methyltransferase [Teredinibacter franksiae]|uniref:arsenite methyltransferase n=1 Tax=Teredinibacter franksiae TaxID=2761453 RepID=UPI0016274253|nr:arsenite methyltransferase [Teredinibacter franksiae]
MTQVANDTIRQSVRELYGKIAEGELAGCCTSKNACCGNTATTAKARSVEIGYSDDEVNRVPEDSNLGLGCGNPRAIASLRAGETVLDLGAGAGFDSFLAVEEVGETGKVIGVDMTPSMISKARAIAEEAGQANVEFRLGEIENLPVADASVDVIISNCVINLSPEKTKVFDEAYRVLKPGGRLAISDIVTSAEIPQYLKDDMALYADCTTGASTVKAIELMLKEAGFLDVVIKPKDESKEYISDWMEGSRLADCVLSATIEAIKPV